MKRSVLQAHKCERPSIVHKKSIYILKQCKNKTISGIIRFSEVYRTLSWMFHLNKHEAREFIKELEHYGLIEIIPYHGIRINLKEGVEIQNAK